jgi:hypothetical protein
MLDEPPAHDRIGLQIGQRIEQGLMTTAFVELPEGVGADDVV